MGTQQSSNSNGGVDEIPIKFIAESLTCTTDDPKLKLLCQKFMKTFNSFEAAFSIGKAKGVGTAFDLVSCRAEFNRIEESFRDLLEPSTDQDRLQKLQANIAKFEKESLSSLRLEIRKHSETPELLLSSPPTDTGTPRSSTDDLPFILSPPSTAAPPGSGTKRRPRNSLDPKLLSQINSRKSNGTATTGDIVTGIASQSQRSRSSLDPTLMSTGIPRSSTDDLPFILSPPSTAAPPGSGTKRRPRNSLLMSQINSRKSKGTGTKSHCLKSNNTSTKSHRSKTTGTKNSLKDALQLSKRKLKSFSLRVDKPPRTPNKTPPTSTPKKGTFSLMDSIQNRSKQLKVVEGCSPGGTPAKVSKTNSRNGGARHFLLSRLQKKFKSKGSSDEDDEGGFDPENDPPTTQTFYKSRKTNHKKY